MNDDSTAEALAGFTILRVEEAAEAKRVAERLATMLRQRPGPMSSAIHISVDRTAVVHCGRWTAGPGRTASPGDDLLRALAEEPGILSARSFTGALAADIEGPAAGQEPGASVLALRHVRDGDAARELAKLLESTGEWKRHVAGFIGASAYVSADGRDFINYPRWTDEAAYRAYMADPRIAEGQDSIARLEVAEPEFVRCRGVISIPSGGEPA